MRRINGWPARMVAALAAAEQRPFTLEDVCAFFAADVVLAITGVDFAAPYRGLARSELIERIHGQGGLAQVVSSILGATIDPRLARRGDVVAFPNPPCQMDAFAADLALGICVGPDARFRSLGQALARVRLDHCALAWRV